MSQESRHAGNVLLLRAATLWLLVALILAWCLVGLGMGLPPLPDVFPGKFSRVVQAHLDFLIMSALLFGFYAARFPLPGAVRWAMVVGAFTNSSLFLLLAIFPSLDASPPPEGLLPGAYRVFMLVSIVITSYGFGRGALLVLRSSFDDE
ncbi:hypothetical protein [Methylococcus sp. EFPC2]|uniref:hypothetical protein n=1 Tax=Methylococcus sp. EFPC2 TaxID=2812648 RepID=UPI001967856B|nr:hypothetical protein [Methylococcus sp. EFPC2]QSA97234.1 hypothetical protein JWZ97_18950 [Methylococcus sp. EFPC2]